MTDKRLLRLLPVDRWPSREEAAALRWFSPVRVGPIELADRTWIPAMVPWRATESGHVTPELLTWYGRFAEGRPGAIVVEATGIRDVPSGPLLRIGHERFVPGLRQLTDVVRERSKGETKLFIQIIDFLAIKRRPEREKVAHEHGSGIRRRSRTRIPPARGGDRRGPLRPHRGQGPGPGKIRLRHPLRPPRPPQRPPTLEKAVNLTSRPPRRPRDAGQHA